MTCWSIATPVEVSCAAENSVVLFIDAQVSEVDRLLSGVLPGVAVQVLSPEADGLQQMTAYLQRHPANTVHLMAHGAPGRLMLGQGELNLDNLDTYADALATWFQTDRAELLLYGCHVAAGDAGAEFIEKLHRLTGATIAASTRTMGNGTWALDTHSSTHVPTPIPLSPHTLTAYPHALNSPPIGSGGSTTPTLVGTLNTLGFAYGVSVVGNYAYVAADRSGLRVIDISTPSTPTLVGTFDTPGLAYGVSVVGNYAYVADSGNGLQVIDISTPSTPTLVGTYDTFGLAYGVSVVGNYAYVADGGNGLQVIDISTPSTPTLVGTYDTPEDSRGVSVVGNYAYVADGGSGLQVIDISKPANPILVVAVDTPGFAYGVSVVVNYAYVADGGNGLQVIDISTPSTPTLVDTYNTPGNAYGVSVVGNYAYVADANSLQVIDISTPANPTLVGTYDTPGNARGVSVVVNYAYVADGGSGLQIIDISGPPITIAGTPQEDSPLTADVSKLIDADGLPSSSTYRYQWQQSNDGGTTWDSIVGATANTFTPGDALASQQVRVQMQYTDLQGTLETITSPSVTIASVNNAPVLDVSKSLVLTAINEDAEAPAVAVGTLVSSLVDLNPPVGGLDNVTDGDSRSITGIAITAADTTNGTWFFSTDNGTNWLSLGTVSDANARLLAADANTRVYFQPKANYNGTLTNALTFRAWDATSGTNGGTANTTINGGATAFSTATNTASITVKPINDAPTGAVTITGTATQGQTLTASNTITDIDGISGSITYQWQQSSDSTTWSDLNEAIGTTLALSQAQVGRRIRVRASYTDGFGTAETVLSAATAAITSPSTPPPIGSSTPPPPTDPARLIALASQVLSITGPGPIRLTAKVSVQGGDRVFDLAIVVVDDAEGRINGLLPNATGYQAVALGRATTLMSVLKEDDFAGQFGQRRIPIAPGQFLQFALIQGGSLDDLKRGGAGQIFFATGAANANGQSIVQYSALSEGYAAAFTLPGQSAPSITIQLGLDEAPAPVGSQQQGISQSELLDLTGMAGPTATLTMSVFREAFYNNIVGLYTVQNAQGQVRDPLTGGLINPGEAGYLKAALANRVVSNLAGQNGQTLTYTASVATGQLLSTFLVVNGTLDALLDGNPGNDPTVFFNYIAANGDGQDHVRLLGDNVFGYEDIVGGGDRDFNDVIVKIAVA